jgi:sodium-dependent dicarboxylate transporter 2/3/5
MLGKDHAITTSLAPFSLSIVGILSAIVLFLLPTRHGKTHRTTNLTWEDAQEIDWGTILLFGGGISLGMLLGESGFALELGSIFLPEGVGITLIIIIAVILSILLSEFASNTASASVIYPILLAALVHSELSPLATTLVLMAASFGASFGFMLPVSTPPNAIVYGTQKIPLRDMVRAGVCFDICGAVLIIAWMLVLL